MLEIGYDIVLGCVWGGWLALYLDRFYLKQVAVINVFVFIFFGRGVKANRLLSYVINLFLLCTFLFFASALIGSWVTGWGYFVFGWCVGHAVYTVCFSLAKREIQFPTR